MAEKRYRIEHADGRAYDVTKASFTKLYEGEGFKITANADGTALETPKAPRARAATSRSAAAKKGAATKRARAAATASATSRAIDSTVAAADTVASEQEPES